MSNPNRLAEIALELFGAKAANEFLQQAWEVADAEAKRELSDAMIAKAHASLQENNSWSNSTWDAREMYNTAVRRLVEAQLKIDQPVLEAELRAILSSPAFKEKLQTMVLAIAEKVATSALNTITTELDEKLKKQARGY